MDAAADAPVRSSASAPAKPAAIFDVDGVISPVHGHTAWGDDVVAGNVFGPAYTSPGMCARLDDLPRSARTLSCWWLTSWSAEMRARMDPFPGRAWPTIADPWFPSRSRRWWKLEAVEDWLARHQDVDAVAWCDDDLRPPARSAAVRRRLAKHGVAVLLIAPDLAVGLTPSDLDRLTAWANGRPVTGPAPK
jgi:hypothetical protein